jgi:hypothetical protein
VGGRGWFPCVAQDNALKSSSISLASRGSKGFTSVLDFLDGMDQSNLGVSTRLQSSHVLPMLFALVVVVALLIVSRLVRPPRSVCVSAACMPAALYA